MRVPLLIKEPFQKAGRIDDRNVQSIDVMPTAADLAGVEIPWRIGGRSAFDDDAAEPLTKWLKDRDGQEVVFPGAFRRPDGGLALDLQGVTRKLGLFDPQGGQDRLYHHGPFRELIGAPLGSLDPAGDARCSLDFDQQKYFAGVEPIPDRYWPARLTGRLSCEALAGEETALVVAVGGTIAGVTPIPLNENGQGLFATIVPERLIVSGREPIAFRLVSGGTEDPKSLVISMERGETP